MQMSIAVDHTLSFVFCYERGYSEQEMKRKRKGGEMDSDCAGLLALCGLKKGRCFQWQPIPCRRNHRGTGPAEAEQCQRQLFTNSNASRPTANMNTSISKKHYAYPDVTVSCNDADWRPENTLIKSPRVVIEVLSPGTEARDRGVKFKAYQRCPTMQEIVLMSQFARYVEIWQRDDQDGAAWHYRHYGPGEIIEINSIGLQIAIAEVYRGLDFAEAEPEQE